LLLLGGMRSGLGRALMAIRADRLAAGAPRLKRARPQKAALARPPVPAAPPRRPHAFHFHYPPPGKGGAPRSLPVSTPLGVRGGEGTLVGPLLGVALLTLLPTLVQSLALYKILAEGLLLVLAFRFLPEGMFGGLARLTERLRAPAVGAGPEPRSQAP